MRKIYILLLLLLTIPPAFLLAQPGKTELSLANRQTPFITDLPALTQKVNADLSKNGISLIYLNITAAPDRALLERSGIILENNLQANIYTASFSRKITVSDFANTGIAAWAALEHTDKISPHLGSIAQPLQNIIVTVTRKTPRADLEQTVAAVHGKLTARQLWKSQQMWEVNVPTSAIPALAALPFVISIGPDAEATALDNEANGLTNNQVTQQPVAMGGHDLHGDGVAIGVGDNSDPLHIDYADRLIAFNPSYGNDHGFHTTGTVGGNGLVDERYKGFANKSTIVSDFYSQVISNATYYLQDFNMVISSNSYGNIVGSCSYAGTYDTYSQFTDQLMHDNPKQLHVFAAANDGFLTCTPYPFGYATITGSFSTAKNVITVGAVPKRRIFIDGTNPYSSKGPVKDGRLKPEIAAVGDRLWSTIENNTYGWNTGTSMACPNVAGASGLLYQRYRQLNGNQDPKSALIKTVLLNGATDFGLDGPDFIYGFGVMNVGRSLTMLDSNRIFTNTINTNNEQTFTFTVPANTFKAKVLLCWNDPAAAALSTSTLINDLDLSVTSSGGVTTLPLVPDPSPASVASPATAQADHRNNAEQVTLLNPAAGTYTIKVKGFNVPEINQEYFVAYDFIPNGITLQYPFGGEALISGDSMFIYWEASDGANPFTLSYSTNNGASWNMINNNIAATDRDYNWQIPAGISSNQCLVRITRNSTADLAQSKAFTLAARPVATLNPPAEQCPGNIKISWNSISGASGYRMFLKKGADMTAVATVTGTTYTFTGLGTDSTYWVAVAPIINGATGMRSVALSRRPYDGSCTGTASHGDLRMAAIISPQSGRLYTSTSLIASQPVTVLLSNSDDQAAASYQVSYNVNGGPWTTATFTDPIAAAGTRLVTAGNLDLSAAGTYHITVAVKNLALADPQPVNDTLRFTVKQIDNQPLNLSGGYDETFESTTNINLVGKSMMGLDNITRWDFTQSKVNGRLKNFLSSGISISGARSMSIDNNKNQHDDIAGSSYNTLTGTFNLSGYTAATAEIRCDFDYVMSGIPKFDTGNSVWVRGSDTDPWLHLLDYQIDTVNYGAIFHVGSLQLSDILAAAGQNFSTSTQLRFTQYDTSRIESSYYGNGVTIDNFRLYTVTDDVAMVSIDSVYHYNCGLSAQVPLSVRIANGVNNTVHNVAVSYQLGNLPVITEILDSIPGNDTLVFTFSQPMDLSANSTFQLSAWIYAPTDTYNLNDSIINFTIHNQPVISAFPYLENFESSNGFFYTDGAVSSWAYGTPASPKINHAASGTKAWKTNLAGNYNKNEVSYLYSPCFDISQMAHPTLSFHMASDIEPPGDAIYDRAYMEYSHDGHNWQRLGAAGQGTNWYNNDSAQAWTEANKTYWHVATIPLPSDGSVVSFRFVLRSDPGTEYEGVAIDDIHVYDLAHPIFNQEQFNPPVSQNIGSGQQADFIQGNAIGATVINSSNNLGATTVQDYKHSTFINGDSTQYYVPKNFTVQAASAPGDSVTLRFYMPDEAIQVLRNDNTCPSCSKVWEVQSLGITKYDDPDKTLENNSLADNVNGVYAFIPRSLLTWVPYDIGYYAEVKVKSFSEFWFNDGGPTHDQALPAHIFSFSAAHQGKRLVRLTWTSGVDAAVQQYELQRADASMNFATIATLAATHPSGSTYTYVDTPSLVNGPVLYYRVRYTLLDGTQQLSVIRSLDWSGEGADMIVYPNPVQNGILNLNWFKGTGDGIQWGLFDATGKRILNGSTDQDTYDGTYQFNFSQMGVTKGIYILQVISGRQEWQFKIVFQ